MNDKLKTMLVDWNDPLGARTMSDAEELVHEMEAEMAAQGIVVNVLTRELQYYREEYNAELYENAVELLKEDMETIDRMPFQTLEEVADFATISLTKHVKFMAELPTTGE